MDVRLYRLPRTGFFALVFVAVGSLLIRYVWLGPGSRSGDFCELRCMRDAPCIEALRAEGLLVEADRALCNGLCTALRTIERESRAERERLGLDPDGAPEHPCLREGPLEAPRPQE